MLNLLIINGKKNVIEKGRERKDIFLHSKLLTGTTITCE